MTAFALVGNKVTILQSAFLKNCTASCSHDFLDEYDEDDEVMFCPKCGAKVKEEEGALMQYEDAETFCDHLEKEIKRLRGENWMVLNTFDEFCDGDVEGDEENGIVFIGVGVEDNGEYDMIEPPQPDMIRRALRELLEPFGLYNADRFGMWAVNCY